MKAVKLILLCVAAAVLTYANFVVDLAGAPKGGSSSVALSSSLGFIATPYIVAAICMAWRKYRNLRSFLVVVCVLSGLMLLGGFGNLAPPTTQ